MHAVVVRVNVSDPEKAQQELQTLPVKAAERLAQNMPETVELQGYEVREAITNA